MNTEVPLVTSFKEAHRSILLAIDQIHAELRSYSKIRYGLSSFNEMLSAHCKRQDKEFFLHLTKRCLGDRESLKLLEFLELDLKELKVQMLIFFDRYSQGCGEIVARNFPRDFTAFSRVVIDRIETEEEYLFPLLLKQGC